MSDRGLPPEGAPACPFVAFEDDRDGRATAPDHRHRCFAEAKPAPRALAHQEAYCLSSAFPVCPTFQDWARREAAAARPTAAAPVAAVVAAPRDEPRDDYPPVDPVPPAQVEPPRAAPVASSAIVPPRRNPPRDWAAPPPWAGDEAPAADVPNVAAYPPSYEPGAVPVQAADPDDWGSASRGLAGSAADRLAGPDPDLPVAYPADDPDGDPDAWAAGAAAAGGYAASSSATRDTPPPRRAQPSRRDQRRSAGSASRSEDAKTPSQDPSELFGPAWERPQRYDAYPSLRTRIGLPPMRGIPRLGIYALILATAALFLFFVGPSLLGISQGDQGAAGASPTPAASADATDSPLPTEPPAPTAQVYIVVKGDTMSKIAKKNGVTVEELLAANKQIKNPNKIKIGDEITIPVPVQDDTGDGTVEDSPVP